MLPPPPGLLSMTKGCLRRSESCCVDRAREDVGGAAGGEGDDHPHRLGGIGRRLRESRCARAAGHAWPRRTPAARRSEEVAHVLVSFFRDSVAVARVHAVELAQQRGPFHEPVGPARAAAGSCSRFPRAPAAAPGAAALLHDMAPICARQASSSRCIQLKASPTVRPTTSAPWLRRISASPCPRSASSEPARRCRAPRPGSRGSRSSGSASRSA